MILDLENNLPKRTSDEVDSIRLATFIKSHNWLVTITVILFAVVAGFAVFEAFNIAITDSRDNNWGAARALLHGTDPYKLYLTCAPCKKAPFLPAVDPMYPASGLVLLWPLAALPWHTAKVTWATLNLTFGIGLVLALCQLYLPLSSWRTRAFAVSAFLAGGPFITNLEIGQHAVFALGWFVAALWAERRGKSTLGAGLLAFSWFKYTLTLPLSLIFLIRSRWTTLLAAGAVHVALTFLAAIWTGTSPFDLLFEPLEVVRIVHRAGHLDVFGLSMRLGVTSMLLPLVVVCTLTTVVLRCAMRNRSETDIRLLCLLSIFAYSVVYHLTYDLVILVIPLIYVLDRTSTLNILQKSDRIWTAMLAVLVGWAWFGDHVVQFMKQKGIDWVLHAYPYYYAAFAVWLYATLVMGLLVVATNEGSRPLPYLLVQPRRRFGQMQEVSKEEVSVDLRQTPPQVETGGTYKAP